MALIVTPKYLPLLGGMERECALLAAQFRRDGWEPLVITEQLGLPLPRRRVEDGITVLRMPSSAERSIVVQLRVAALLALLLLRHRREVAFAVVRTMTLPALVVGLLKRLRLLRYPTLVTAETGGAEDDVVALGRRPLFPVSRLLVSGHDHLNGICQANVDHLRELDFPREKITLIPNGIDTSMWAGTPAPERVDSFLFLGRIEPAKGVHELVEAFRVVHARHPRISLTFAGDGPSRAQLEARCAALGLEDAVSFVGRVDYADLGALFGEVDCLVLPSYSEGMPLSVLEAAAHRRVLIVTDVGDMRRLFGGRIRICPPRDEQALAEAMEAAVSDPHPAADYEDVIRTVAIESVARELAERLTRVATSA